MPDNKSIASLHNIIKLTNEPMQRVNELILSMAQAHTEIIPKVANYLANAGGKRIRPMLTLASAQMFSKDINDINDGVINLAAAVEFMHNATLLHDDVVDESEMRRGKVAARKVWGNQTSVLVGDFLLGQAFRLMVEVGSLQALDILAKSACIIAEGEVMQLVCAKDFATNQDDYFRIIDAKTAQLFKAAAQVGAVVAGAAQRDIEIMGQYGKSLGIAFQLVDDVLDYDGKADNLGKNIGDDFREGKITLPLILCYNNCNEAEKEFWQNALAKPDDVGLERALTLLKKYNSLEEVKILAKQYGNEAASLLADFSCDINIELKEALLEVVKFCICRIN